MLLLNQFDNQCQLQLPEAPQRRSLALAKDGSLSGYNQGWLRKLPQSGRSSRVRLDDDRGVYQVQSTV